MMAIGFCSLLKGKSKSYETKIASDIKAREIDLFDDMDCLKNCQERELSTFSWYFQAQQKTEIQQAAKNYGLRTKNYGRFH